MNSKNDFVKNFSNLENGIIKIQRKYRSLKSEINLLNYSVQPSGSYPTGTSTSNSLNFGNYHFYISSRAGSNYFLNGKVKSILIYGTKLSSSQINQNYEALNHIPPTDISLSSNTISETATIGSLVGAFSATDSDTSDNNLSFSFASGNGPIAPAT